MHLTSNSPDNLKQLCTFERQELMDICEFKSGLDEDDKQLIGMGFVQLVMRPDPCNSCPGGVTRSIDCCSIFA